MSVNNQDNETLLQHQQQEAHGGGNNNAQQRHRHRSSGSMGSKNRDPVLLGVTIVSAIAALVCMVMVAATIPLVKDVKSMQADLGASMEEITELKWAAKYEPPRYFQVDRGTCWDFATIGLLEQSYRESGVRKGYLKEEEYVQFSEQAYGISMIAACAKHPEVCDVPGDFVLQNSTEGGEIGWIYSLSDLYDQVLPVAVCPYTTIEYETQCPGIDIALDQNPIKFDILSMELAYNSKDARNLLIKHRKPLGWSSLMHVVSYYFPCTDDYWQTQDICNSTLRVACPTDRNYFSQYCGEIQAAMYNMDGEFFMHGVMEPEGGHAMNIVGFNDGFVTREGFKGGFIIRNSWEDRVYGTNPYGRGARGSHSIAYWMQEISSWDEAAICPNPLNPANWLSCVQQSAGPTGKTAQRHQRRLKNGPLVGDDMYEITETCLDNTFMQHLVNVSLQPVEFQCIDETLCDLGYRYFLISSQLSVQGDLMSVSMLKVDPLLLTQSVITTPLNNPSSIAYIWQPIDEQQEQLQDDPLYCGYYFWPYDVLDTQVGSFRTFYAHYFEIEWDPQSYYINRQQYGMYNYTLLSMSTGTQPVLDLSTTNPHDTVRY